MSATLLILAAGLGTRFKGGIKQLTPVGGSGELLMEYSVYDAVNAGFDRVIFVIRHDIETELRSTLGDRLSKHVKVYYCFQETALPEEYGISAPGRKKPWGTVHAVLSAKDAIGNDPFVIVNADDYYGPESYKNIYNFLTSPGRKPSEQCMGGFILKNTLSSSGSVTRGVCSGNPDGILTAVNETYHVSRRPDGSIRGDRPGIKGSGEGETVLPESSLVSMNMWGFDPSMTRRMEQLFRSFLKNSAAAGTLDRGEYPLPFAVDELIRSGEISVKILPTHDKWYGMTYTEDIAGVSGEFVRMAEKGIYPSPLF